MSVLNLPISAGIREILSSMDIDSILSVYDLQADGSDVDVENAVLEEFFASIDKGFIQLNGELTGMNKALLFCVERCLNTETHSSASREAKDIIARLKAISTPVTPDLLHSIEVDVRGPWESNCAGEIFLSSDSGDQGIRIGHFQGDAALAAYVVAMHNAAFKLRSWK